MSLCPSLFAFTILQRAKCSAPWISCIWKLHSVLNSADNFLGGSSCMQDIVPLLCDPCWPPHECQEQSKVPIHNYQLFTHLVPDYLRKHSTLNDEVARCSVWFSLRAIKFAFLLEGKYGLVLIGPQSSGLFTSIFDLEACKTCHVLWAISWGSFSGPWVKSLDTAMQSPRAKS